MKTIAINSKNHTIELPSKKYAAAASKFGTEATVYTHIEAAVFGERWLGKMQSNVVIEDLRFINGGVHGLVSSGDTKNVTIRTSNHCRKSQRGSRFRSPSQGA